MRSRIILAAFIAVLFNLSIYPQQIGSWRNYSSMRNVTEAQAAAGGIWAATSGGAFFYSFTDNSYLKLVKAEGLSSNSITALALDRYGNVWLGGETGSIDIYDATKKAFVKKLKDIASLDKGQKRINGFSVSGDSIFVSTDFGVSLLNAKDYTFQDTYLKLGSFPSDTKVNSVFFKDVIYAATENGVAKQRPGATNPSAPEAWENFTTAQGLPSNSVTKITGFKDTVIAATPMGLSYMNGSFWNYFLPQFTGVPVVDIAAVHDSLFIVEDYRISLYYNGKVSLLAPSQGPAFTGIISAGSHGLFATTTNGIVKIPLETPAVSYFPEGPASNIFTGLSVDKDGNLWAGSGSNGNTAVGFYKYDGQNWTNYSVNDVPSPRRNPAFFKTYVAPDNTSYFMNWGEGFLRNKDGKFQLFTISNTPLSGIDTDPGFLVVQGLSTDSKGNLWALTYKSGNRAPLYVLKSDSTWDSFTSSRLLNRVTQGYALLIDQYDTKWMVIGEKDKSTGNALYYFNRENPLYTDGDYDDNGFGIISSANGLNASDINTIALDRRGELWVGTSDGVKVITDTRDPRSRISTVDPLRTRVVNCIAVDALNQKWVGTQQGVFVVSSDGTKLVANYTTGNSPLPSDIVTSIAIDNNTGTVYMGTDFGLASVTTTAVKPQESFTGMFIYPNPAVIQNGSPVSIAIEGLVRDTDIKILSISGKVLNTFTSPGAGVAVWDGKDMDGNYVASGIYIIVAYDKDGTNVASAKVAVLRK